MRYVVLRLVVSCHVPLELRAEVESLDGVVLVKSKYKFRTLWDFSLRSCDLTQCQRIVPDSDLYFCNGRPPPGDALPGVRPTPISGMLSWKAQDYLLG